MNIKEFAALKVGDEINNDMTNSRGTVTEVLRDGVKVRWNSSGPAAPEFVFSVNSTAWFHWSKVEDVQPGRGWEDLTT